jgi:hypothetical protein
MTNNKQHTAVKLYTEQQVIKMIEKSRETGLTAEFLILTTSPIELPSDEEIWDRADEIFDRADSEQSDVRHLAFMESAKWMRDKIQEQ